MRFVAGWVAHWRQPGKRHPWISCPNTGSILLPHSPSHSLPTCVPQTFASHVGSLYLPRLTGLFSFDNDVVRGLEQVTAALACEGQIGKVRVGPHGAKMCCLAKDKAGFMQEFLLSPLPDHYPQMSTHASSGNTKVIKKVRSGQNLIMEVQKTSQEETL